MTEISYSDDDKAKSSKLTHSRTPYICQLASGKPCSSCTDLASFDALDASPMNNSMKERRHLLRRINARHDPLSSHLPSELISQIFLAYHEDTGYSALVESQDDLITRTATPLLLASVCAMWRDIAIDIPSLWSSLLIQDAASWYLYKDLVVQWLDRSKSRPLSIRISADDGFAHRANHLKLATLFEIIRRYADRWQLINVRTTTEIFRMFLGHCYINSPRLETLIFHIVDSAFERAVDIITLKSPQLKTLHMSSACLATVILDWNHLTAVQLKAASIDEILEVLRRAPGLLRCDLVRIYDDDAVYTLPATLFHPSLLFLMLYPEEGVEQVVCKALERLTLPHLQRLTYNFKHTSPFNMVIALPFLVRSGREIYISLFRTNRISLYLSDLYHHHIGTPPIFDRITHGMPEK